MKSIWRVMIFVEYVLLWSLCIGHVEQKSSEKNLGVSGWARNIGGDLTKVQKSLRSKLKETGNCSSMGRRKGLGTPRLVFTFNF